MRVSEPQRLRCVGEVEGPASVPQGDRNTRLSLPVLELQFLVLKEGMDRWRRCGRGREKAGSFRDRIYMTW